MTALAYGQLATQDEYEVALRAAGETRVQANVRRNRIGQFTAWARSAGIQHPAQVTWDEWSHWLLWLDHESGKLQGHLPAQGARRGPGVAAVGP